MGTTADIGLARLSTQMSSEKGYLIAEVRAPYARRQTTSVRAAHIGSSYGFLNAKEANLGSHLLVLKLERVLKAISSYELLFTAEFKYLRLVLFSQEWSTGRS